MPEIGDATFQSSAAFMFLTWHHLIFLFSEFFLTFKHLSKEIQGCSGRVFYPVTPKSGIPSLLAEHVEPAGAYGTGRAQEAEVSISVLPYPGRRWSVQVLGKDRRKMAGATCKHMKHDKIEGDTEKEVVNAEPHLHVNIHQ